ncbi:SpoIIE family protein phosphatase [Streptomyces toxytricini]|uniref:SpoIIE family protein phosphatase n=1 Tax=Streptomyces toxytricini TaxID=67369 RepID=A0ABW8EMS6_STRT5
MGDTPARDPGAGHRRLGEALLDLRAAAGASIGMLYLPAPTQGMLHLALTIGVAREFAVPWSRVGLRDPIPVADAVRERRLVWLGGQEETASRYPRLGLVVPYRFSLAATPLDTEPDAGAAAGAGLVMLWPGSHGHELAEREREALAAGCARLAEILRRAADDGHPVRAAAHPVILAPRPPPTPGPVEAAAAMAFIRRLPGGSCALDLNGKITFITQEAADLLGSPVRRLVGALPWEALPWMDTPAIEEHYRAAVMSRLPRSFTAVHPAGHRVRFDLHPDDSGISVRITAGDGPAAPAGGALGPDVAVEPPPPPPPARPESAADAAARPPAASEPGGEQQVAPGPSRATALYQLMHLAASLTEAAHAQDVVDKAADQLVPALGAQAMALLVEEERRLRIVGHRGYTDELMTRYDGLPVTAPSATTEVIRTRTPLFFESPAALLAAYPGFDIEDGMGAWGFVPLITSNRPVGCLVLAYSRPRPFAAGEKAVLISLAGLIAQALERARLYDSAYQLARSLQTGLLPHDLPHVPRLEVAARYLPAGHGLDIGGDFYDLIHIDGTTAAAAIGDVQGHNVGAAALMGQVRTAVHASAGAPPAEVLARTNRLLTDLEPGLFTSCLYAHIDLGRHRARLATAGHPPPLLRRADGTAEVVALPPGLLLGIDPDAGYTAAEIPFEPGSLLALYTDGLVESPALDIEETIAGVAAHLARTAGDRPLEAVADDLLSHARGRVPATDDIALLLLRSRLPGD